jgi:acyl-CoA thioester hydrolase
VPAVFEHPVLVEEGVIDALGHASNLAYLQWMQEAALAHTAAQGWPGETYRRLGAGWVVRSHRIEYLHPAQIGEELVVRTWVATMGKVRSLRRYQVLRRADGRELARGATDWAFIDYTTGTPRRVPPEVRGAFEVVEDPPLPETAGGESVNDSR